MGSIQNRRIHRLPCARLVEQAMDKAEAASILTLCVEESYASSTIFAAIELLAAFGKVKLLPEKLKPSTSIQASF